MRRSFRLTPATALGLLALFVALGGSAYAVGQKVVPQARCAQGAVRGIAVVQGNTLKGIANMSDQFSSDPGLFGHRFNCSGGAIETRRLNTGVYQVRFLRNAATTGLASSIVQDGSSASVARMPDGSFQVTTRGGTNNQNSAPLTDGGFTIIVF
jgi:hypothetical protein